MSIKKTSFPPTGILTLIQSPAGKKKKTTHRVALTVGVQIS